MSTPLWCSWWSCSSSTIEYYENEIKDSKAYLDALQNDTATMEKVAREQYMMKRDNEVVYLIETQE